MSKYKVQVLFLVVFFLIFPLLNLFAQQGLNIKTTTFPNPVKPGHVINYQITVSNTTNEDMENVSLKSLIPDYIKTSYYQNRYIGPGDFLYWTFTTIPAGKSKTVSQSLVVNSTSYVPDNAILNSFAIAEITGVSVLDSTNVLVKHDKKLSIALAHNKNPLKPGDSIRYSLLYSNTGSTNLSNCKIEAKIPEGTTFLKASGGGVESNGIVTWDIGRLETEANGQLTYEVVTDETLIDGEILYSSATLTTTSNGGRVASTDISTVIEKSSPLKLALNLFPNSVKPGHIIDYQLTVSNTTNEEMENVSLKLLIPDYIKTSYYQNRYIGPGDFLYWTFTTIPAGKSKTVSQSLIVNSTSYVPDNAILNSFAIAEVSGISSVIQTNNTMVKHDKKLSIALAHNKNPLKPGDSIRYSLLYSNTGSTNLSNCKIEAKIPEGTTFLKASGGGVESNGIVTWDIGRLETEANGQLTYEVVTDETLIDGEILYSSATLTTTSNGGRVASTDISTVIEKSSPLKLALNLFPNSVKPGHIIDYQLTVSNTTNEDMENVSLQSLIPDYIKTNYYQSGRYIGPGDFLKWKFTTIPAGKSKTVSQSLVVSSTNYVPDNTILNSFAIAEVSGFSPVIKTNNTIVKHDKKLSLAITQSNNNVQPGDTLQYHILYGNSGSTSLSSCVLNANIPEGTTFLTAHPKVKEKNGQVSWELGNIGNNANGEFLFEVVVDPTLKDGTILYGSAEIVTTSNGGQFATTNIMNVVKQNNPIVLSTSVTSKYSSPGNKINFLTKVTNTTEEDIEDFYLITIVPDYVRSFYSSDFGAEGGRVSSGDKMWWKFATISAGQSKTINYSFTLNSSNYVPNNTIISNYTYTSHSLLGSNNSIINILSTSKVQSEIEAEMAISQDNYPVQPGGIIKYTLLYANTGSQYLSNCKINVRIPEGTAFLKASNGGVENNGMITWNIGSLRNNANGQLTFKVVTDESLQDGKILDCSATLSSTSNEGRIVSTYISNIIKRNIPLKLAFNSFPNSVKPRHIVNNKILISNTSKKDMKNIVIKALVPKYVNKVKADDFGATGDSNAYVLPGKFLYWNIANLRAGKSKTIPFSYTVKDANIVPNNTILNNSAIVQTADTSLFIKSTNTLVQYNKKLSIALSQLKNPIEPGDTIRYSLLYSNSGTTNLSNCKVEVRIPEGTVFLKANKEGTESNGIVSWNIGELEIDAYGEFTFEVITDELLQDGKILNSSAALTTTSNGGSFASADISTIVQKKNPLLLLSKVSSDYSMPDSTIQLQLTLVNTTEETMENIKLYSLVPDYCKSIYQEGNGAIEPGKYLEWEFAALPAGSTETVSFSLNLLTSNYLPNNTIISSHSFTESKLLGSSNNSISNFLITLNPPTGIEVKNEDLPKVFTLAQNYPNPFNPTTIIKYELPKAANVKIVIYNAIGQKVQTLVDKHNPAGRYSIKFNGSNLASGIYFYRISAGDFVKTKKLMLLK